MSRSFRNSRNNSRSFSNIGNDWKQERCRMRGDISEVETSQDQYGGKGDGRGESLERNTDGLRSHNKSKDSHQQESYSRSHTPTKYDNSHSSTTRLSSQMRNSNSSFSNTFKHNFTAKHSFSNKPTPKPTIYTSSFCPFPPPPLRSLEPEKSIITISEESNNKKIAQILQQLGSLDYSSSNYCQLKDKFCSYCKDNVRFVGKLPQSVDCLGDELLKNGMFHWRWVSILRRQEDVQLDALLQSYYVLYRDKVDINVEEFERALLRPQNGSKSLLPQQVGQKYQQQKQASLQLKRYRSLIDQQQQSKQGSSQPTTSTTKLDMMILFQQLKQQLHVEQIQKSIQQNVRDTIQKWKKQTQQLQKKNNQQFMPICDIDLMFESQQGVLAKWNDQQEIQKRKQAIQQLQKERIRQRSPLSNRFRMMHECQTNGRRMHVEMACMFLNIQVFYYLQDLEILNVQEIIFSDNQQIVVLKAYAVEYEPKVGMMKLEPRVKTLISVYKFSGLTELIRLEKTYGRFDGIVVYPQSFDIRKYLMNNKQLSLINQKYLKDIKTQIESNQQDNKPALNPVQKIDY